MIRELLRPGSLGVATLAFHRCIQHFREPPNHSGTTVAAARISNRRTKISAGRDRDENEKRTIRWSSSAALCSDVVRARFKSNQQHSEWRKRRQWLGDGFKSDVRRRSEQFELRQHRAGMPQRKHRQLHADRCNRRNVPIARRRYAIER